MIQIKIADELYQFDEGITLEDIIKKNKFNNKRIVAGLINNQVCDLTTSIQENCLIDFVKIDDEIGNRVYRRSLFLVLARAIYEVFPGSKLSIEHSLSNGIYCELKKNTSLSRGDLKKIKIKMKELISADLPLKRREVSFEEAKEIFVKQGFLDKVALINQIKKESYTLYELDGVYDYYYSNMVPSTGYLSKFDLHYKMPGFILLYPQKGTCDSVPDFIEQPKLANVFYEYEKWGDIIGVGNVGELNRIILENRCGDLIRVSEALHEKKIATIADEITSNIDKKRVILIAGPSSSGKTTFAQRLAIHLRVNGLRPVAISTDNYFVDRDKTPLDEEGNYDFEAIEAIDLSLLNDQLIELLQGKLIEIPVFNFKEGCRAKKGKLLQIKKNQPIIIEGIHSLNDRLTPVIPQENKYRVYISALTQLNIDRHNRIPTTDTRLLRRLVRDNKYRSNSALKTIEWWPDVRKGEAKNIFPYQEKADLMFNSALIYELAVLKKYAVPLLSKISPSEKYYYQAQRLLNVLKCFLDMPENDIPRTSILREFIGNSCFR